MFSERFTAVTFGSKTMYMIADAHHILYIGFKAPSPMRLLRNDRQPLLQQAAHELIDYFNGCQQPLACPIVRPDPPFTLAVYTAAQQIPYGECVDATVIAREIGQPHSVRAINVLCRSNPLAVRIPTHRILPSDGVSTGHDQALRQMERRFVAP